jgi:hypothetical protein
VIFGTVMAALLGTLAVWRQRGQDGTLSPRQTATVLVPSADAVGERVRAALASLPARVLADDGRGRLQARTRVTWRSWGEHITVTIDDASPTTRVMIASRPRLASTVVDYGKAHENIDHLVAGLGPHAVIEQPEVPESAWRQSPPLRADIGTSRHDGARVPRGQPSSHVPLMRLMKSGCRRKPRAR